MFNYAIGYEHLDKGPDPDSYWDEGRYILSQTNTRMYYSNTGFSMLGELVRQLSGVTYEQYVIDNFLAPLLLEQKIYPDPGHRKDEQGPTAAGVHAYLTNSGHPYRSAPVVAPLFGTEPLPKVTAGTSRDSTMVWAANAGPPGPTVPAFASKDRYSGRRYMGGAPLAAGGWTGDGASLILLIRAFSESSYLMPVLTASQLWDPQWKNWNGVPGAGWDYGLGWYVRGNWVAWAGGSDGSMATVMHNKAYDFTVVHLANVTGNGLTNLAKPLMQPQAGGWDTSPIGQVFPCITAIPGECTTTTTPY